MNDTVPGSGLVIAQLLHRSALHPTIGRSVRQLRPAGFMRDLPAWEGPDRRCGTVRNMDTPSQWLLTGAAQAADLPADVADIIATAARSDRDIRIAVAGRTRPLPPSAAAILRDSSKTVATWAGLPGITARDVAAHLQALRRPPAKAALAGIAEAVRDRAGTRGWDPTRTEPLVRELLDQEDPRTAAILSSVVPTSLTIRWLDVLAGTQRGLPETLALAVKCQVAAAATGAGPARLEALAGAVAGIHLHRDVPADALLAAVLSASDGSWHLPPGVAADLIGRSTGPDTPKAAVMLGAGTCLLALHAHPDDDPVALRDRLQAAHDQLTVASQIRTIPPMRWFLDCDTGTIRNVTDVTTFPAVMALGPIDQLLALSPLSAVRDALTRPGQVDVSPLAPIVARDANAVHSWLAELVGADTAAAAVDAARTGRPVGAQDLPAVRLDWRVSREPGLALTALTTAGTDTAAVQRVLDLADTARPRTLADLQALTAVV